jgi:hypothetical protein
MDSNPAKYMEKLTNSYFMELRRQKWSGISRSTSPNREDNCQFKLKSKMIEKASEGSTKRPSCLEQSRLPAPTLPLASAL